MIIETIASICIGLGLAASVGFRVFLPLLLLSIASHFDVIPVGANWEWVGTIPAMSALGVATLLEILAFYIPWVDNILDTISIPAAGFAGTAAMASTAVDIEPLWKWALAIIAGGGTASLVKGSNASTRLASSTMSLGTGNPLFSTLETFSAAGLSLVSIFLWPLAAILTIMLLIFILFVWRNVRRRFRSNPD